MKLSQLVEQINKFSRVEYGTNGVSKMGTLEVPYDLLVNKLGQPTLVDDDGVRVEWNIIIHDGGTNTPVTIYDWNEDPTETPIKDVTQWNVASTNKMGYTNTLLLLHDKL